MILDAENRIDWCNDVAEHHFDLNLESDQGQPIGNLLRQPEFIAYLESADYAHPLELRSARTSSIILSVQVIPYGDAQKLLLSRDVVNQLAEFGVEVDHFYKPAHQHIFTAIRGLMHTGMPVDIVTVADELRRNGLIDEIGGPAALLELQNATPSLGICCEIPAASVTTSCKIFSSPRFITVKPMRFAGTCTRYSKKAMPQLMMAATNQGFDSRLRRWPYQANVMKTLDAIRRATGVRRDSVKEAMRIRDCARECPSQQIGRAHV